MKQVDTIAPVLAKRTRRAYSTEFKSQVVKACCEPGVSVAGVALAHGLNANMVRRWLREQGVTPESRRGAVPSASTAPLAPPREFVPVSVDAIQPSMRDIRIELRRGAATVSVSWPVQAADACAAWLREWLR